MHGMSAPSRTPRHRQQPPAERATIHHAAGISQKTQVTGQTGGGQARLTLGGSTRRCPRDWNGDPAERFASGSAHQGQCARATRPSVEKQSAPSSRSSTPPAHPSIHQLRISTEVINDEKPIHLDKAGSPCKGLGLACCYRKTNRTSNKKDQGDYVCDYNSR